MKIKNSEAVKKYSKINDLLKNCSFKAATCLAIVKNKKKLQEIVEPLDEAQRIIAKKFLKKDSEGNPVVINDKCVLESPKEYYNEIEELMNKETEVEFEKIALDDLGENDILGEYVDALSDFIE